MERSAPVVLLLFLQALAAQENSRARYVGDLCTMRPGVEGVCRSIAKCPEWQHELQADPPPHVCSYHKFTPIVCCPTTRIATRMCKKYADAVYRHDDAKSNSTESVVDQCAMYSYPHYALVGGTQAGPNQYPHMALLGYGVDNNETQWQAGGSLISNRFVLTAGHAIVTIIGRPKLVRLGELDLNATEESKHEDFQVMATFRHPDYEPNTYYNDIGLLKLDRDVVFTAAIRPACLHPFHEIQDKKAVVSGWGSVGLDTGMSNILRKVILNIVGTDVCNASYTGLKLPNGIVEDKMLCAGSEGITACRGYSGGPLQVEMNSPYCMYGVIGITSFGKGDCGATQSPDVYTRVSYYLLWIETVVWP